MLSAARRTATAVLAALLVSACGSAAPAAPAQRDTGSASAAFSDRARTALAEREREEEFPAYAATATAPVVPVHAAPGGEVVRRLDHPQPSGAPLTLLLRERRGEWLEVFLPVRPNGSTGWVRAADVRLDGVPYRLDVARGAHELRLYDRDELVETYPIGVGQASTPTPGGTFYIKELLEPTNPGGFYGPFAYGLSGFSNALDSFAGTDAVIGIHGTSDPSSVGKDVSSGCIRMHNDDIRELVQRLPLGTPVRILA